MPCYEYLLYDNLLRRARGEPERTLREYWTHKNDALDKALAEIQPSVAVPASHQSQARAELDASPEARPEQPSQPSSTPPGQQSEPTPQGSAREQFFKDKVAAARHHLDEIRRRLEVLGQRLDAAKLDEEVDVEADADEIDDLIWRYNDAMESARDAWLRDNLAGELNTRLLEMLGPSSLGLPSFTDEQQAQRAMHQGIPISERLGRRDVVVSRVVLGMQVVEISGNVAGVAVGVGVVAKAFTSGSKWVVVKTIAGIGAAIGAEQAAEAGLRAVGASEVTIRGARLAAAVIAFILVRRRSGSSGVAPKAPSSEVTPPSQSGRGIWDSIPQIRWEAVEQRLGKNLPGNFRTIDKFEDGIATSIKSLDLGAKSYANPSNLTRVVRGYIDKVAAFEATSWNKTTIESAKIKGRSLELAVPPDGTDAQRAALQVLVEYGKDHGVLVKIVEMW